MQTTSGASRQAAAGADQAADRHGRPSWLWRRLDGLMRRAVIDPSGSALIDPRRIYILPTRTGLAFAAMLVATLVGSLNYQNNLGLFFTFLMAAIALVSMHHCWFNLLGLRVAAQDAVPVFLGQTAHFPVTVKECREKRRGLICVHGGGCAAIAAGDQARLTAAVTGRQRGEVALGEVLIETRFPLGLFRAWSSARVEARVLVYPRPAARAPVPPRHETLEHHASGDRGAGADDFVGPRAYRLGDSLRQLDWKALARERGLVVKQFGGDRAARVWLDWDQHGGETEERLARLARQVIDARDQGLSFGLRVPGRLVERGRGDAHMHRCLEVLARFPHGGGRA